MWIRLWVKNILRFFIPKIKKIVDKAVDSGDNFVHN